MQPFGAEQQHDGLQIHADVGPLGPAQVAVDVAEQGGGRAETVPVADGRPLARLPVLARNAERAVALLAEGGSALPVRGLHRGRVHLVLPLVPGVAVAHALDGARLELGQRRAGQHVGVPRLDVRSGQDGDQAAADSTRSSTSLDTGSSLNPRTARRLVTASYTSMMIASLPPAIRFVQTHAVV